MQNAKISTLKRNPQSEGVQSQSQTPKPFAGAKNINEGTKKKIQALEEEKARKQKINAKEWE